MSLVDLLPMRDHFGQDWTAPPFTSWLELSELASGSSAPSALPSSSQASATLGWGQPSDWADLGDEKLASLATINSAAARGTQEAPGYQTPDAQTSPAAGKAFGGVQNDAMINLWDMDLLEELSKGSLSTTTTTELKIPDPIIAIRKGPPLLIAPSLPVHMPAAQEVAVKACWDNLDSIISAPVGNLGAPPQGMPDLPKAMALGTPANSGGKADARGKGRAAGRKRASPHNRQAPEKRTPRDEAARARNARNQQLHRQRQREKLEVSESKRRELEERLRHLTVVDAGLRAHNQLLEASEQECLSTDAQGNPDDDALWGPRAGATSAATAAAHQKLAAVFSCISRGLGKGAISAAEVAQMSLEEVFLFRQQYGAYMGRLFQYGASSKDSAAHAELLQLVALWAECEAHLWEHCPRAVHRFAALAQQHEDDSLCLPNALKWQSILAQLGLSVAQKNALKQVHRRLVDQLLNVTAERFHVSAMLKEVSPDLEAANTWQGSSTFLRVREAHKRLAASIRSEHCLMRDAHLAFRQIATPVQQATCDVLAHPGALDIIALLSLLRSGL